MKTYSYLNILMFPTTECNLRCKYCFHAEGNYEKKQMDISFVERVFDRLFPKYEYLQFIWHGGEPLCVGLDFYRKIVELENRYKEKYGVLVDNGIMTNGTLVNAEFAQFFADFDFDVGVSFDGIHNDELRGKTDAVLNGINLLNEYHCNPDIVTVITLQNVKKQIENYELIKKFKSEMKFNPVVKIGGGKKNQSCDLDFDLYVSECCKMFDHWMFDVCNPVMLQPYYTYLRDILENTSSGCQRTSCLGRWIALHPNGDIYPCVREGREQFCFGNIFEINSIEDIWESDAFFTLLQSSIERRTECETCDVYQYCHGGCPVNALTGNGKFSCITFSKIFNYVLEKSLAIKDMGSEERKQKINPIICDLFRTHGA